MKVGQTPAWLVSMLLHVVVLLSMALIAPTLPQESIGLRTIDASSTGGLDEFDNLQSVELPTNDDKPQEDQPQDVAMPESVAVEQVEVSSEAVEVAASEVSVDVAEVVSEIGAATDLLKPVSKPGKSALETSPCFFATPLTKWERLRARRVMLSSCSPPSSLSSARGTTSPMIRSTIS